jgi:hypothetical protein
MAAVLRITVETGPHKGTRYCLGGSGGCLIGRDPDCLVQLSGTERDRTISRRHCRLAFDADEQVVHLQDLGSQNGTYVNGRKIERLDASLGPDQYHEESAVGSSSLLTVGGTTLRLDLMNCPPQTLAGETTAQLWADGASVKKNCPVRCST